MKGCLGNKLLKEINPTGMKGLKREKVIQQVKNLINASYSFQGHPAKLACWPYGASAPAI